MPAAQQASIPPGFVISIYGGYLKGVEAEEPPCDNAPGDDASLESASVAAAENSNGSQLSNLWMSLSDGGTRCCSGITLDYV